MHLGKLVLKVWMLSVTTYCTICHLSLHSQVLRPFLLRRLKKEVESQLPEKVGRLQYLTQLLICVQLMTVERQVTCTMMKTTTTIMMICRVLLKPVYLYRCRLGGVLGKVWHVNIATYSVQSHAQEGSPPHRWIRERQEGIICVSQYM